MSNISVDSYGACLRNKDFDDETLIDTEKMHDEKLYSVLGEPGLELSYII